MDCGCTDKYRQPLKEITKGVSTLMVNTGKGKRIFNQIKNNMFFEERTKDSVISSSPYLQSKSRISKDRKSFFDDYFALEFSEFLKKKYCVTKKERSLVKYCGN